MKTLTEHPTPETDYAAKYGTFSGEDVRDAIDFARDLERRLAMCREALESISKYRVMKSHYAGSCVSDDVIEEARDALEATKPKP